MKRIFIPARSAEDWRMFLARPDKHWKTGYSAKALAYCWQEAKGFPDEIAEMFARSPLGGMKMLLAIPEYVVPLYGGKRGSHNDLFVLAKDADGQLVSMTVEGKVSESFGPTLAKWGPESSPGKKKRLAYLQAVLGLEGVLPGHIRYQLLHRTASAVILARRFNALNAVMVVHSFSQSHQWLEDYQQFTALFGAGAGVGELVKLSRIEEIGLYSGWATGDQKYLEV